MGEVAYEVETCGVCRGGACVDGRFGGKGCNHGGNEGGEGGLGGPLGEIGEVDHAVGGVDVGMAGAKGHCGGGDDEGERWDVWVVWHEPDVNGNTVVSGFVGDGDGALQGEKGLWGSIASVEGGKGGVECGIVTGGLRDVLQDVGLGLRGVSA